MKRSHNIFLTSLMVLTLVLCAFILWILLFKQSSVPELSVGQQGKAGEAGQTGQRGDDGLQGIQGFKGDKGEPGTTGSQGVTGVQGAQGVQGIQGEVGQQGKDGEDGKTPVLQCNTKKNRWEYRYDETEAWSIMKDQDGKSVPCKAPVLL